jgi:hypothetical protein
LYYIRSITVERRVEKGQLFGYESPQPALGRLATHNKSHGNIFLPEDVEPRLTCGISATRTKIMEELLIDGKLNPAINPTQANFLKIFAA